RLGAAERRIDLRETTRVVAGHDAVRTMIDARLEVDGAPIGRLAFGVPGTDEVRAVTGPNVLSWWLDGTDAARTLYVRLDDLRRGAIPLRVVFEAIRTNPDEPASVPRLVLAGAREEFGR